MTHKTALGITVATTAAAVLGVVLLFGDPRQFASIDRATANHSVDEHRTAKMPNPALSRIRVLVESELRERGQFRSTSRNKQPPSSR